MNCMKCGRELETEQVFCNDCLLEMEKYPVSPNATVHLPLHRDQPFRRTQPRRRTISPEEQIKTLKKRLWILGGILAVTLALLIAMVYPTVNYFLRNYHLRPGQNYSTVIHTTPGETEAASDGFSK